jgi:predicted nucleotidyltransferase component of viral defense system
MAWCDASSSFGVAPVHEAIRSMLSRYDLVTTDDHVNALREILQEVALLGLWRIRFFEHAAFYGGTAMRILFGLDRYSEDLDFSLLRPGKDFSLGPYGKSLKREVESYGFEVDVDHKAKVSQIDSAFLKANTHRELLVIGAGERFIRGVHPQQNLKIKIEVDTDPPGGFETESRYVLLPIPFAVRTYTLPDLFAGKLHAVLCRRWRSRVKGRDWYDLVWYVSHHPEVRLSHLEARMRQTCDWREVGNLAGEKAIELLHARIDSIEVDQVRREVAPFVKDQRSLEVWSRDFFHSVAARIVVV